MVTNIESFLCGCSNKFIVETYLEKEKSMLQIMAKDIVAKIGNDTFVENAIAQDKNTQIENPIFTQKGFLLASDRVEWFKNNHQHLVAYSEILINSGVKTTESWGEWSRWCLLDNTQDTAHCEVHNLSNQALYDVFIAGDKENPYFEYVAAACAMLVLSVITDRFLSWIDDAMISDTLMNANIAATKH